MVVSTYCRRCRSHIEIRDGKVIAPDANPEPALGPPPESRPAPPPLPASPVPRIRTHVPEQPSPTPPPSEEPKKSPPRRSKTPSRPLLSQLRQSLTPKPKTRNVLCEHCLREFTAPVAANATHCPRCGAYLLLHDYEIDEDWDEEIVTRGNVVVLRHGVISETSVVCHDFTLQGRLDAPVRCTGTFLVRRSGLIRKKVHCAKLRIERGAKVKFIYPVETGSAEIHGEMIGSIRATGPVVLHKRSAVVGNITTPSLVAKPGARHSGRLRQAPPPTEEA